MTADSLATLERHRRTLWLGQSVDTSVLHTDYPEFATLPVLTSIGCAIRKPHSLLPKFDAGLRQRLSAGGRLTVDSGGFVLMTKCAPGWDAARVAGIYQALDADHLVAHDVPPNDASVRRRKYRRTLTNLAFLLERFGRRVIAVAHGATDAELEHNCRQIVPGGIPISASVPSQWPGPVAPLSASRGPRLSLPGRDRCVGKPYCQATALTQGSGVRGTAPLLRDVVATLGIGFERHEPTPDSDGERPHAILLQPTRT